MIQALFDQVRSFLFHKKPFNAEENTPFYDFYRKFIDPNALCFDVGANIGNRTDIFLSLGARVVCIEPQPACVEILQKKYGNRPDVIIIGKGLAPQPGNMTLSICESANTISTFSDKWKQGRFQDQVWNTTIEVPVTTLDALVKEFGVPAFCKIDVEGFEYQVIQGLSSPIGVLSFEFTREFMDDAEQIMQYLTSLGNVEFNYVIGESLSGSPDLVLPQWTHQADIVRELNAIPDPLLWGDIYARFI